MRGNHMCMCLLACLIAIIAIHALPAPISTEVATINPDHELAKRIPSWGQTWRVFAFNAEIYWKAGGCIALGCYQGGDVNSAEGVGIATGIIYGVAAFAKSFLPEEWRPGQPYRRRGENADWDKYLNLVEDAGLSDDLPLLLEFQEHHRDQVTFHTKYADLDVSRLQVMHPIKRSMENIIRIRTHPDQGSKRQEAYYGIEAFFHEESDYGYPPDRGWVGELANTVGNSISEHQGEGDMCMKMVNFDGATSYSYIRYDGTPDNEEYDNVFGCDVASYD